MDCKYEDTNYVERFWHVFNNAYKEVNLTTEKFNPTGWCSDMASANLRKKKIYGENVVHKIKGCEFPYKESINKKAKQLGEKGNDFKTYALDLLTASTQESYNAHKSKMEDFIKENECTDINGWLKWWDERRSSIFRCNQAEVIHVGWIHRYRMDVSLLDTCMFDIRDALILEDQLKQFEGGSYSGGSGLNQK